VKIPVMGCGGITCAEDVLEFLVAGCAAVQVGTASFSDPGLLARLPAELEALLEAQGIADVRELIGSLVIPRAPAAPQPERGPREGVDAANALGGAAGS
jgi:dihydroorotate dehydrogenase (NAD+) catalytic subunit